MLITIESKGSISYLCTEDTGRGTLLGTVEFSAATLVGCGGRRLACGGG